MSAREQDATLYFEEFPEMELKHGDYRNLASSHSCIFFIKRIPEGFFIVWHSLVYRLFCCVGLAEMERLTFSKLKFKIDPFSSVSTICAIWVSLKSCCWLDSNSFFIKIALISWKDIIKVTVVFFCTEVLSFYLIDLKVVWNLSLDIGRHERSLGWTKNLFSASGPYV